ncbi:hypothetical protein J5N97_026920 [Dioscorea zingiberensis]|uniref:Uncharacterized protein n=1 Tax=Dioscorea zingiberensis TaxID=325984 RepID=A0A9D5C347_9LILI|nr:hypothetical protein J5N97_026920 [Dioscorea zingiberensis]
MLPPAAVSSDDGSSTSRRDGLLPHLFPGGKQGNEEENEKKEMEGFSPASPPRIFWNSRKRSASARNLENALKVDFEKTTTKEPSDVPMKGDEAPPPSADDTPMSEEDKAVLSERRKALLSHWNPSAADREIDGLNEQLAEDARCLEHLQLQLLQEKHSERADMERENSMLHDQVSMLMNMLEETEAAGDVDDAAPEDS